MSKFSQFTIAPETTTGRLAVFIDGDNVSHQQITNIEARAEMLGRAVVLRAYAGTAEQTKWFDVPGVEFICAGAGKNAADVLLALDALELALAGKFDTALLVSSDRDFRHLAFALRRHGIAVYGLGETKAPETFSRACTGFSHLPGTTRPDIEANELNRRILALLPEDGVRTQQLGALYSEKYDQKLRKATKIKVADYLRAHPAHFRISEDGLVTETATSSTSKSKSAHQATGGVNPAGDVST